MHERNENERKKEDERRAEILHQEKRTDTGDDFHGCSEIDIMEVFHDADTLGSAHTEHYWEPNWDRATQGITKSSLGYDYTIPGYKDGQYIEYACVWNEYAIYYYVNGRTDNVYGLFYVDGYYYYVQESGKLITGQEYFVSETNGLLMEGKYTFDQNGRIILENDVESRTAMSGETARVMNQLLSYAASSLKK